MKRQMKCISIILLLVSAGIISTAQENKMAPGSIKALLLNSCLPCYNTIIKKNNPMFFLGGGLTMPGGAVKDNANIGNAGGYSADVYVPFIKTQKISWGLNGGGALFSSGRDAVDISDVMPYNAANATSAVAISKGAGKLQSGYNLGVGPQANIYLGDRFLFSPIFQAGYMSLTHKAFSAVQTTSYNGSTQSYNLLSQGETKTSGFHILPKARFQYLLGAIGLWAEGSYHSGTSIKNTVTTYSPAGEPDSAGIYNIDQLLTGQTTTKTTITKYSAWGLAAGVVITLKGKPAKPKLPVPPTPTNQPPANNDNTAAGNCELQVDNIVCEATGIHIYLHSTWISQNPLYTLTLSVLDNALSPVPTTPSPISGNSATLGAVTGMRNFDFIIPLSYGGQTISIGQQICKTPGAPDAFCCTTSKQVDIPKCCTNCNGITIQPQPSNPSGIAHPLGWSNAIVMAIFNTSGSLITKVTAQLQSVSVSNATPTAGLPNPDFAFTSGSQINYIQSITPFSLSGSRSNIVISNYTTPIASVFCALLIDNMTNRNLLSYSIKYTIFLQDGTYCEKVINW